VGQVSARSGLEIDAENNAVVVWMKCRLVSMYRAPRSFYFGVGSVRSICSTLKRLATRGSRVKFSLNREKQRVE
jgi:hypothetical protein